MAYLCSGLGIKWRFLWARRCPLSLLQLPLPLLLLLLLQAQVTGLLGLIKVLPKAITGVLLPDNSLFGKACVSMITA